MEYKVKITANSGDVITLGYDEDGKTTLKLVDIMFDTIDNEVMSKSDGMLAKITIKGDIKEVEAGKGNNIKQLIGLFNWSKSSESDEIYRKVEIELWTGSTRLRCFVLEDMFVVDYNEIYVNGNNKSEFVLKLTQLEKSFEKINTFE